ncbi:S24 family peptidase [Comamonas sp. 4034]|uniref:S24 family peptidase n=1 Tax=Comamonas sp. 4034 TaxID=3156455 RepID=UPI003D2152E7
MLKIWTVEEEAEHLRQRFAGVKKAAFARDFKVPGGASMLSQHLSGHRPMNLAAATAYANGFDVKLEEISPRLAIEVKAASTATSGAVSITSLAPIPEPGAPGVQIPLLANAASMGPGADVEHDDVLIGAITVSPEWLDKRIRPTAFDALRFIHAYGDSMSPTFEDGDILLVDTGRRDPSVADGVYVLATSKRLFIKRVTERFDGSRMVSSDNKNVTLVQELNGDHEINVLGRVVWVWNGRKL